MDMQTYSDPSYVWDMTEFCSLYALVSFSYYQGRMTQKEVSRSCFLFSWQAGDEKAKDDGVDCGFCLMIE